MIKTDENRIKILNYSLKLEKVSSYILGYILDLKNFKESKSFGNKSTALSFNQKINLLLDYGAIEKDEKVKLDSFLSIRNQFMHNLDCKTFQDVFNSIDGLESKFKKLYPNNFKDDEIENNLEKSVDNVFEDSFEILGSLKGGIENKMILLAEHATFKKVMEKLTSSASKKFDLISKEIRNDDFNFHDKNTLIDKLEDLREEIFIQSLKEIN